MSNSSAVVGGAIYLNDNPSSVGSVLIVDSVFANNTAWGGGAVFVDKAVDHVSDRYVASAL